MTNESDTFPTNAGATERNLRGFKLGDIDGSWPDPNPTPKPSVAARVPLALAVIDWTADIVTISLSADLAQEELSTMIHYMRYDPAVLEYVGMTSGTQTSTFRVVDHLVSPGDLRGLSLGWKGPATSSGDVLRVRFRVLTPEPTRVGFSRLLVNDRVPANIPEIEISKGGSSSVPSLPGAYALSGYPNPFNPMTRIEFSIPAGVDLVHVNVRVYDIAGRLVRTLVDQAHGPGSYGVTWDGADNEGNPARSGIYFVRAEAGDWSDTKKMTLLK
jgi:hypothetical protein